MVHRHHFSFILCWKITVKNSCMYNTYKLKVVSRYHINTRKEFLPLRWYRNMGQISLKWCRWYHLNKKSDFACYMFSIKTSNIWWSKPTFSVKVVSAIPHLNFWRDLKITVRILSSFPHVLSDTNTHLKNLYISISISSSCIGCSLIWLGPNFLDETAPLQSTLGDSILGRSNVDSLFSMLKCLDGVKGLIC